MQKRLYGSNQFYHKLLKISLSKINLLGYFSEYYIECVWFP